MLASAASAQTPATAPVPACPAVPAALPAELSGWGKGGTVADGGTLAIGSGATVRLVSAPTFAVASQKPLPAGRFGGSAAFTVATAGTYRVALGGPVWVDVVQGTATVASTAHGHGPACSAIRKTVDFDLTPGRHVLQISNAMSEFLPVLIARL